MELTINIKEQKYIASFLNLIRQFDYVEIIDVKEDNSETPVEHKILLDERLKRIEEGKITYKNWDLLSG
jgi:hypothetical protein